MATVAESQLWAHSQALGDTSPHSNPSWLSRLHDPSAGTGWVNYSLRGIYKSLQEETEGQEVTYLVKVSRLDQPLTV